MLEEAKKKTKIIRLNNKLAVDNCPPFLPEFYNEFTFKKNNFKSL